VRSRIGLFAKLVQDWAIGPVVALAALQEVFHCSLHGLYLGHALFGDVHRGTGATAIPGIGPVNAGRQAQRLVVAHHLGRDIRLTRSLTYVERSRAALPKIPNELIDSL
jgi:hypothetical protein